MRYIFSFNKCFRCTWTCTFNVEYRFDIFFRFLPLFIWNWNFIDGSEYEIGRRRVNPFASTKKGIKKVKLLYLYILFRDQVKKKIGTTPPMLLVHFFNNYFVLHIWHLRAVVRFFST